MFKKFISSVTSDKSASPNGSINGSTNETYPSNGTDFLQNLDDVLLSPQQSADSYQDEANDLAIADSAESPIILSPITSIESYNYKFPPDDIPESYSQYQSIQDLPLEILMYIIDIMYHDTSDFDSINKLLDKFIKVRLISKTFNLLSLKYLYKYANFNRPHSFHKFLINLNNDYNLGNFVQFIDFETFTSIGLGRTGKMNQEIQMVTSKTILNCLQLTPNLIEFLASESIQDDLDSNVLYHLFNNLPNLQSLDFCGASSSDFFKAFNQLIIERPLRKLFKLSLHDCSNLSIDIIKKILPNLISLRKLDLTHTSITSTVLLEYLPKTCNITHLSLSRCSKLTTRDLINFLVNHPAVNNNQLQWLNLSIDSNVVSPLDSNYLFFTLNHLNASNLQYLNLKGMPITERMLNLINFKFRNLVTLSIGYSAIDFDCIIAFLHNSNLLNIDLTGCKLNKSQIISIIQTSNLMSIEFDSKVLQDLTPNNGQFLKTYSEANELLIWKYHDNNGRRAWVYKLENNSVQYMQILQYGKLVDLNLTYYDLTTGEKKVSKVEKPAFLKYVGKKINCSIGFENIEYCKHKQYLNHFDTESIWPGLYCERGIYNYYSLNI